MGISYNPKIVTDGLVLCLDAGNTKSYSQISAIAFDGSGDYLTVNNNAALNFGSSDDFTVEGWMYLNTFAGNSSPDYGISLVSKGNEASADGWTFYIYQGSSIYFGVPYVSNDVGGNFSFSTKTWYHLACTRTSGTVRLFVNGNLVDTQNSNTKNYTSSQPISVGRSHSNGQTNGYIRDLRITKGIARYTANFTPPKTIDHNSDPYKTSVSLLLQTSAEIKDYSNNNFSVIVAGDTTISAAPGISWNDLSGRSIDSTLVNGPTFDTGNLGSLSIPSGASIDINAANFKTDSGTWSMWLKSSDTINNFVEFMSLATSDTHLSDGMHLRLGLGDSLFTVKSGTSFVFNQLVGTNTCDNNWHNIVITYQKNVNCSGYFDGKQTFSDSLSTWNWTSSNTLRVCGKLSAWSDADNFTGNVSNVSIYNRALTLQEVSQNFNALRGRYGI